MFLPSVPVACSYHVFFTWQWRLLQRTSTAAKPAVASPVYQPMLDGEQLRAKTPVLQNKQNFSCMNTLCATINNRPLALRPPPPSPWHAARSRARKGAPSSASARLQTRGEPTLPRAHSSQLRRLLAVVHDRVRGHFLPVAFSRLPFSLPISLLVARFSPPPHPHRLCSMPTRVGAAHSLKRPRPPGKEGLSRTQRVNGFQEPSKNASDVAGASATLEGNQHQQQHRRRRHHHHRRCGLSLPWSPDRFYLNVVAGMEAGKGLEQGLGPGLRQGLGRGQGQDWGKGRIHEGDDGKFEQKCGGSDDDEDGGYGSNSSSGSRSSSEISSSGSSSSGGNGKGRISSSARGGKFNSGRDRGSNNTNSSENDGASSNNRGPLFSLERLLGVVRGKGWPGVKAAIFGTFSIDIRYGTVPCGRVCCGMERHSAV